MHTQVVLIVYAYLYIYTDMYVYNVYICAHRDARRPPPPPPLLGWSLQVDPSERPVAPRPEAWLWQAASPHDLEELNRWGM